jgi:16S rRNA C967 or C1407 C5-methylase (RsmB/RsmF family)/NOL1/NOP2/fmu family ribosome biogenesis protein
VGKHRKGGGKRDAGGEIQIPPGFARRMAELLGGEAQELLAAMRREVGGLRVNTLRVDPEQARERIPFDLEPLPGLAEGFLIDPGAGAGRHPYHHAGLFYLQDPSAMLVARLVDPLPGEWVADLSAAPGGKATHLAARMEDRGFLLANDPHPTRARELAGNLERFGVRNAAVSIESVERLGERLGPVFHRVLLDAPCSGEAMFMKSGAAREGWSVGAVEGCARRQEELLTEAARLVRPGGLLAYSTCTFSPEEDERVVALFLREHPDFEVEKPPAVPGSVPGRPEWVEPELRSPSLDRAVRLWPHRVPGAGHFIALLRRAGGDSVSPEADAGTSRVTGRSAEPLLDGWLADNAPGVQLPGVSIRGEEIFAPPANAPVLDGLRLLRPGWWLGSRRRDRFEPAHALAMALRPTDGAASLDLSAADPRVSSYLRGETVQAAGPPGWLLVQIEGLPLGWGKRVGDTVKNHLPKGLRALR